MEEKLKEYKEKKELIELLQNQLQELEKEILEALPDDLVIETEDFKAQKKYSVRYKYSEKVEEFQKEKINPLLEELKELKDYEKKTGVAEKLLGKARIQIV